MFTYNCFSLFYFRPNMVFFGHFVPSRTVNAFLFFRKRKVQLAVTQVHGHLRHNLNKKKGHARPLWARIAPQCTCKLKSKLEIRPLLKHMCQFSGTVLQARQINIKNQAGINLSDNFLHSRFELILKRNLC